MPVARKPAVFSYLRDAESKGFSSLSENSHRVGEGTAFAHPKNT